jgi:phosphopantetheinyl transferase
MSYYIGLSFLSNNEESRRRGAEHKALRAEARRILSAFEGRPIGENDMARDAQGRPFFPGREVDFNISHSGNMAAVSYVSVENPRLPLRTGCDIELIRPRSRMREIATEFFSAPERNYIFSQDKFIDKKFYEIWTLKECFLKLYGLSVFDMAACPCFISGDAGGGFAFCAAVSAPVSFCLYELSGDSGGCYMLATALEGIEQEPEMRMFSHLPFACKKTAEIKAALNPAETVRPKM